MGWKHYQTVDPQNRAPDCRGLFGVHLLILSLKFQFSKSIKPSIFHIFLNLTYPFRKQYLFPKTPKNLHETAKQCMLNEISRGIWRCLKRDRDIGKRPCQATSKQASRLPRLYVMNNPPPPN